MLFLGVPPWEGGGEFRGHFFLCLPKRNVPGPPKRKALLLVRWNLLLAETLYVVIPEQDTLLCIADRSLSRLRGSPLPGAGCLGPVSYVGGVILTGAAVEALSLAQLRLSCRVLLRRLWPPGRFGVGCAAWGLTGRLVCVSRGRACPVWCGCGGYAAGALWGWLCRLGLGRVLGHRLAWARLTGRVQSPAGGTYHRGTKNLNERTWQDEPTKRKSNGPNNPHPAAASRVSGSNCGRRCTITYPARG